MPQILKLSKFLIPLQMFCVFKEFIIPYYWDDAPDYPSIRYVSYIFEISYKFIEPIVVPPKFKFRSVRYFVYIDLIYWNWAALL